MSTPSAALYAAWASSAHVPTVKVEIAWDGINLIDESTRVLSVSGVFSISPETRAWQPAKAEVTLSNEDRRYSPEDFNGPLYQLLPKGGWPVRISAGYGSEQIVIGTYRATDLTNSEEDMTATLSLNDVTAVYAKTRVNLAGDIGVVTGDLFGRIATAGGLVNNTHYTKQTGDSTVVVAVGHDLPLTDALNKVALAEGGRFFCDETGVLRFWSRTNHKAALQTSVCEVRRSTHAYEVAYKRKDPGSANRVLLRAQQRLAQVEAVVFDQEQLCQGGYVDVDGNIHHNADSSVWMILEAEDPTTFEVGGETEFTTINTIEAWLFAGWNRTTWRITHGASVTVTNSLPPASSAPSNTIYYQWTPDGSTGRLDLWPVLSSLSVVHIKVNGKAWRVFPAVSVGADDKDAQAANGGVVVQMSIDNDFITTDPAPVAKDLLLMRSGSMASVDLPAVDFMPWLRPFDVIDFVDDSVTPEATYRVMVVSHDWQAGTGGKSTIGCIPVGMDLADPPPIPVDFVVPTSAVIQSRTEQEPPWQWGPGGAQPAIADFSDWG